jgi:predicted O-linked N-acetylglucosamine transferase (SPINDLY family)
MEEPNAASPKSQFQRGLALHQQGRLKEAERIYRVVLQQEPTHAGAWYLLGVVALQSGCFEAAAEWIGNSINLNDQVADAHSHRAFALRKLGRLDDALACLDKAIALEPDNADAHDTRANVLREMGRLDEAMQGFDRAIALGPDQPDVHINRGILLRNLGQIEAALVSYDRAIALQPGLALAYGNRGNALLDLERSEEALSSYETAIALRPDYAEAYASRGNALLMLGRFAEALSSYDQAIALRPDYAEAYGDRGNALRYLRREQEALASYDRAIALQPEAAGPYYSRGELLRFEDRTDDAVASFEAAVAANRLHGAARLAACLAQLPILYHGEAEIPIRRQRYLAALARLGAAAEDSAVKRSLAGEIGPPPFYLPYQGENDVVPQSTYGRLVCRILGETNPPAPLATRPTPGERIRLGIVSGFFRAHTIFKLFLEGWLTEIDRSRFELICFHTSRIADDVTARAIGLADRFMQGLPSRSAWRKAISDAAPHVLLYPEVGMDAVAGWLVAQRLAPVQCVSWGHPVTTGMPTVDYFLSSDLMEPPDAETHYTERLVRLPHLGIHYTPDEHAPPALDHATLGLDPARPVFWSGQTQSKYLPQHDWIFPRIAQMVGPCQFIFVSSVSRTLTEVFRQRLAAAFTAAGLDAEQYCVIWPKMPHDRYIGAVGLADVTLDTPGWSGGKSTLDFLAQNRAIVTWPGRFMRGRHTAAILQRIGCKEAIAGSLADYVTIAARLCRDVAWQSQVRESVASRKHRAYRDQGCIRVLEGILTEAVAAS